MGFCERCSRLTLHFVKVGLTWSIFLDNSNQNCCRICGLDQDEPLWGEDGKCPIYTICECCGAEAGIQDYSLSSCREYRKNWLAKGAQWRDPEYKPVDWSLEEQMKHIPAEFK